MDLRHGISAVSPSLDLNVDDMIHKYTLANTKLGTTVPTTYCSFSLITVYFLREYHTLVITTSDRFTIL